MREKPATQDLERNRNQWGNEYLVFLSLSW